MTERRLQYNYALIDVETGECVGCITSSYSVDSPAYVLVPRASNDYIGHYYLNGSWYEDAEGTIPWTPPV